MPPPIARKEDDDEQPPALDEETFDWPPPDEVIKKMRVYDFATTETRPPETEPPRESNAELASTTGAALRTAEIGPPSSPARTWPLRHVSVRTRLAVGAVALVVIGAGGFGAWKLLRQGSPIRPVAPPTVQGTRTPDLVIPPSAAATPGPAGPATDQQATAEMRPTAGAASSVLVRTDTAGARVWIDGVYRGRTPLNAVDLQPGTHAVSVEGPAGRIQQTISLTPGSSASVFVSTGAAVSGGIAVNAPAELEIRESGRVVGTSRADRILLDPGRHTLDLVNDALGFTSRQVVDVVPGKIVPIAIQFPNGTLNINALPWAEVFVDGERIGETPIGNLAVRVGSHEITFRHPELGEVKRTVEVTLRGPARISVDLEKKER